MQEIQDREIVNKVLATGDKERREQEGLENITEDGELSDETSTIGDTSNSEASNGDGTDTSTLEEETVDNQTADTPNTEGVETIESSTD